MRGLLFVTLVTLLVGCGGDADENDAGPTAAATTPAATATNAAVAQGASLPPTRQAATPTDKPEPSPTAREVVPTPVVVGTPSADLPVAGQIAAIIPLGVNPMAVAAGHGSIWVHNDVDGTVSRIDPATNAVVATIPVATPIDPVTSGDIFWRRQASPDLAIDARSVWATKPDERAVVQIDPQTNTVVATIPMPAKVNAIAVNESSLWVSLFGGSSVVRVDTATGEVVATVENVPAPIGIAVYQDAVWVANNFADTVTRIDPETNQVVERISLHWPGAPITGAECSLCTWEVMANEHGVWVTLLFGNHIARIDPATNRLAAVIPVGIQPKYLASDARGVWVGHESSAGVLLIDPATNQVVAAVRAEHPQQFSFVALQEDTIWAVGGSTNDVVRIELQRE